MGVSVLLLFGGNLSLLPQVSHTTGTPASFAVVTQNYAAKESQLEKIKISATVSRLRTAPRN